MKRRVYKQVTARRGQYSDQELFYDRHRGTPLACCGCGLVHDIIGTAWRPVRKNGKIVGYRSIKGGKVSLRFRLNKRATAGKRKAGKFRAVAKAIRENKA